MSYWSYDYFGGTDPMATGAVGAGEVAGPAIPFRRLWDGGDVASHWQVLAWAHDCIAGSGLIEPANVAVGRGYSEVANAPRVWLIPVSYTDRPDAPELATRTVIYAANLAVPFPRGEGDDIDGYQELARFEDLILGLLEPGPPGCNPSLGGLQKAVYDSPPGQKQDAVSALQPMLAVTFLLAVAFDRDLPVAAFG